MKHNNFPKSGIELLSTDEMLRIRGGAEVPKPTTRPREVWDPDVAAFTQRNAASSEEVTFLSVLLNWLKK